MTDPLDRQALEDAQAARAGATTVNTKPATTDRTAAAAAAATTRQIRALFARWKSAGASRDTAERNIANAVRLQDPDATPAAQAATTADLLVELEQVYGERRSSK